MAPRKTKTLSLEDIDYDHDTSIDEEEDKSEEENVTEEEKKSLITMLKRHRIREPYIRNSRQLANEYNSKHPDRPIKYPKVFKVYSQYFEEQLKEAEENFTKAYEYLQKLDRDKKTVKVYIHRFREICLMINFDWDDLSDRPTYSRFLYGEKPSVIMSYVSVMKHMALSTNDNEQLEILKEWYDELMNEQREFQVEKQQEPIDLEFISDEKINEHIVKTLSRIKELTAEKEKMNKGAVFKLKPVDKRRIIVAFILSTYRDLQGRSGEYAGLHIIRHKQMPKSELAKKEKENFVYIHNLNNSFIYIGKLKASGIQDPKHKDLTDEAFKLMSGLILDDSIKQFPSYQSLLKYMKTELNSDKEFTFNKLRYKETSRLLTNEEFELIKDLIERFKDQRHTLITAINYYYRPNTTNKPVRLMNKGNDEVVVVD